MDLCTVETGLLRKKPCTEKAVTKCANCERGLCAKHAVPQVSAGHKIFLCSECAKAWKQSEKTVGTLAPTPAAAAPAKKPAEQPQAAAPKPAAPAAAKPAAPKPAAPKPAAPKPAPVQPAPVQQKKQPPAEDSGPLEFTLEPTDPKDKK